MDFKKIAYQLFETDMVSSARYGAECIQSHKECRVHYTSKIAIMFQSHLMAESVCFPTKYLPLVAMGVEAQLTDSLGRTWSRWAVSPSSYRKELNVVSQSPDKKTLGVWSSTSNVLYATVDASTWKVSVEKEEVGIDIRSKESLIELLRKTIRKEFAEPIAVCHRDHPNGVEKLINAEHMEVKSKILDTALNYQQSSEVQNLVNELLKIQEQYLGEDSPDRLMTLAEQTPAAYFLFCKDIPVVDSVGKHWTKFRAMSGSIIATCVEDGSIASFDASTLLMEWLFTEDMDVFACVLTNTRQIVRKDLHETAYTQLSNMVSANVH